MNELFKKLFESLRDTGNQNWPEAFKALEPMFGEQRAAKACDVWYGTDICWLNMKKLVDLGMPMEIAKDIVVAVYASRSPGETFAEDMSNLIPRIAAVSMARPSFGTDISSEDAEFTETPTCKCGSTHCMLGSNVCAACYTQKNGN